MAENANRPVPPALLDDAQHGEFLVALRQGQDQLPLLVAVGNHAVDVQAKEVGLHVVERPGKVTNVVVAVVEVVNDPDVCGVVVLAEVFTNRHKVLRFTAPAAVIVQPEPAPGPACPLDDRQQLRRRLADLLVAGRRFRAGRSQPDLRMQAVFLE